MQRLGRPNPSRRSIRPQNWLICVRLPASRDGSQRQVDGGRGLVASVEPTGHADESAWSWQCRGCSVEVPRRWRSFPCLGRTKGTADSQADGWRVEGSPFKSGRPNWLGRGL